MAWHSTYGFQYFYLLFRRFSCSYPLLISLIVCFLFASFRTTANTNTITLTQTKSPTKKKQQTQVSACIQNEFGYSFFIPHNFALHPTYTTLILCSVECVVCNVCGTVCNVYTKGPITIAVAITILRLKTNCINQYVLFMRMRAYCVC